MEKPWFEHFFAVTLTPEVQQTLVIHREENVALRKNCPVCGIICEQINFRGLYTY